MIETLPRRSEADTEWFVQRPLRPVHPLGPVRPPGPPRVGAEPRADPRRRTTGATSRHFDPDLYDPATWAREAYAAGMSYCGHHHQAPRRLLPVGLGADRLQGAQHAGRARPAAPVRRRVPRRGAADRLLPLADRLASPGVPRRRHPPDARRRGVRRREPGPRHRRVPRVPARPGARAADRVRQDRRHLVRLLLPGPDWLAAGKGKDDWGSERAAGAWSASCSRASSSTTGSSSAATSRRRSSTSRARACERRRPAGRVGGLPDAQRQLGLRPRQPRLEAARAARADAGRHGLARAATCCSTSGRRRAASSTRARSSGCAASASGCACTSAVDLRLHGQRPRRRRPTAATPSAATGSTCTSSPGRSATSTSTGLAGRVE